MFNLIFFTGFSNAGRGWEGGVVHPEGVVDPVVPAGPPTQHSSLGPSRPLRPPGGGPPQPRLPDGGAWQASQGAAPAPAPAPAACITHYCGYIIKKNNCNRFIAHAS